MRTATIDILVVVPVLVLLALTLVRFGPRPPRLTVAIVVGVLIFGGFLGLRAVISDEWIWPNSEVDRRTRWLQKHLLRTEAWETKPILFLLGSSATYYGVDAESLEMELARLGSPATVLSFCMPGDNHHERLYMLEVFLRKLGAKDRKKLAKSHVILLEEVFDEYDRNPLYRMEKEAGTERAILFLNSTNAPKVWSAYLRALSEHQVDLSGSRAASLLLEHVLLNRFAVGAFSKMLWPERSPRSTPPFFPLEGHKSGFQFESVVADLFRKKERSRGPEQVPFPQWLVWQTHLREVMDPYVDTYGFYSLPLLEGHRSEYQIEFLKGLPPEVIKISGPTEEEFAEFLQPALWFDGVHPSGLGAQKVTMWMARRVHQNLTGTAKTEPLPPPLEEKTND